MNYETKPKPVDAFYFEGGVEGLKSWLTPDYEHLLCVTSVWIGGEEPGHSLLNRDDAGYYVLAPIPPVCFIIRTWREFDVTIPCFEILLEENFLQNHQEIITNGE